ncbi:MAG: hypothetical protein NZ822_02600 [Patescibacteria group bacterium]|nr:hypothetical protein [Patescibacteria group bacterium]
MIFSPEEKYLLTEENLKELTNLVESLRSYLKKKKESYSSRFPFLDDEFRINLDYLRERKLCDPEEIDIDSKEVNKKEKTFQTEISKPEEEYKKLIGEMLEIVKTIYQEAIFKNNLIIFRTSKYDDYFNGVDQIMFDAETLTPIAATDITSDIYSKEYSRIFKRIYEGSKLKYCPRLAKGAEDQIDCQEFEARIGLVTIFLVFKPKDMLSLAKALIGKNTDLESKTLNQVSSYLITGLINQIHTILQEIPEIGPQTKTIYNNLLRMLTKIKEEHQDSSSDQQGSNHRKG